MVTLNSCRAELRSIIGELREIESGVRREFTGIGEDLCGVLVRLNRVDTNRLAAWLTGE